MLRCRLNLFALAAALAVAAAAGSAAGDGEQQADAVYRGEISPERNAGFFAGLAGRTLRRLTISSGGGDVAAAIELAEWVHERGLDIVVEDRCLSACANYVFPAARRKEIRPGAVVAWHGNYHHLEETGLWRDDVALRMRRDGEDEATATRYVRAQVERLVALERAFFAHIGVDQRVCWIGKLPPWSVPDYYFLSVPDMARFGITGVTAPEDYPATDVSGFAAGIVYLSLEER